MLRAVADIPWDFPEGHASAVRKVLASLPPVDETHHKLRDGTILHVSVWTGPKTLDKPAATPAFEDGWRRITMAQ